MDTKPFRINDTVSRLIDNRGRNTNYYECEQYPIIDNYMIKNELYPDLNTATRFLSEDQYNSFLRGHIRKGDLLLTLVGNGIGNITLAPHSMCAIVQNTIGLSFDERLFDSYYAFYYFKTIQYAIRNLDRGSSQPSVNREDVLKMKVWLPNMEVQKTIGKVLRVYDNLIEVNNKRIKLLEQMAENLYKEWFVRFRFPGHETAEFENGIPKGWTYRPLDSIAFVTMGQSPESQYYNYDSIGLPFHQGVGSYGAYYLVDDMYSSQGTRIAEPNSIIFSVRAPVGRINLTLNRIILGRGLAGINSKEGKNWFLLYMLKNKFAAEDLIGNGSIFSSVKKEELLKQKFLIPSPTLISKYDSAARKIEGQIRLTYLSNKNLIKQRDLLLPRLMSGKLEVRA